MSLALPASLAGRYQIIQRLGDGTFSETYRAVDTANDTPVAIKVLREQFARDPGVVARFEREAAAAAAVHHPNVVGVFASGRDGERLFIVMELVEGGTLKERIRQAAPLPVPGALALTRQLLQGLAAIHAAGIVHRDVKPQNVLLAPDGTARLTDFGIARAADVGLTETGVTLGTAAYMAPEQALGAPLGPPADLYAVGVLLFELLTGQLPFPGDNPVQVLYQQVHAAPPPPRAVNPALPAWLEGVVLRALAKDPGRRYRDAGAMLAALDGDGAAAEDTRALGVVGAAPPVTVLAAAAAAKAIPAPPRGPRLGRPIALLAAALVLAVGVLALIAGRGADGPTSTQAAPQHRAPAVLAATPVPTDTPTPTRTATSTPTPTPIQAPTPTSSPAAQPAAPAPTPPAAPPANGGGKGNGKGKGKDKHGRGDDVAIPTIVAAAASRRRKGGEPRAGNGRRPGTAISGWQRSQMVIGSEGSRGTGRCLPSPYPSWTDCRRDRR